MGPRELIAAACLLFTVAPAGVRAQQAADSPGAAPKPVEASEDVVVIGRLPRLPLPPSKVPASVQVIEAADLQRAARPSLPDALVGQVPGCLSPTSKETPTSRISRCGGSRPLR